MSQLDMLIQCFRDTRPDLKPDPRWIGSPFEEVHNRSPKVSGSWSERAVRLWLQRNGIDALPPSGGPNGGHDIVVGSDLIELKTQTTADGKFTVNQVRDQRYRFVAVVCLLPSTAKAWLVRKEDIRAAIDPQHGGKAADPLCKVSGNLRVDAHAPQAWMGDGDLESFIEAVRSKCPTTGGLFA